MEKISIYTLHDYSELVWKNGEQMDVSETINDLWKLQSEVSRLEGLVDELTEALKYYSGLGHLKGPQRYSNESTKALLSRASSKEETQP